MRPLARFELIRAPCLPKPAFHRSHIAPEDESWTSLLASDTPRPLALPAKLHLPDLADRLARDEIRINAISPGQIRTPMMNPALDDPGDAAFTRRILLGRIGEPAEIGRAVRFLLSEEASYITASEFVVDGGNISSQRM